MREKVIVIGAGMGGLSAAIRLQLAGYNVEIYEKNQTPGGKMSQIKAEGYTFDVGPTIVMMPDLYCSLFELAGKNPEARRLFSSKTFGAYVRCLFQG